jgi:sugar phosphate isomerase/epimerase
MAMELVVGCTTRPYSFLSFAEACERIADAGYTDVAVFANVVDEGKRAVPVRSDSTPDEVAAARRTAADAGLAPSMLIGSTRLNLGLDAAVDDYKQLIDNAAALGTKWLLDCGTGKEELFDDYYELMRRAALHAQQAGVNITLKPHGGITLTVQGLIDAYEKVSHPAFGICYDPGNIIFYTRGELRPETDIDKVAPMVTTGIIKDCVIKDGKPDVMVTAGEGLVDFDRVISGLVAGGFRGPLYVECVGGRELDEIDKNVKSTLKFVKDILAEL